MTSTQGVTPNKDFDRIAERLALWDTASATQRSDIALHVKMDVDSVVKSKKAAGDLVSRLDPARAATLQNIVGTSPMFKDAFARVEKNKFTGDVESAGKTERKPTAPGKKGSNERISADRARGANPDKVNKTLDDAKAKGATLTPESAKADAAKTATVDGKPDFIVDSEGVIKATDEAKATAQADENKAADGAKNDDFDVAQVEPEWFNNVFANFEKALSPSQNEAHAEAGQQIRRLEADLFKRNGLAEQRKALENDPSATREDKQALDSELKALGKIEPVVKEFGKAQSELDNVPLRSGLVEVFEGLRGPGFNPETKEGRTTQAILRHMAGDPQAGLSAEQAAKVDAYFATPEGQAGRQNLIMSLQAFNGFNAKFAEASQKSDTPYAKTGPLYTKLQAVLGDFYDGKEIDTQKWMAFDHEMRGAPPAQGPDAAGPAEAPNASAPRDPKEDLAYNPKDRSWFGLSKARRDELKSHGQNDLIQAIDDFNASQRTFYMSSGTRLNTMLGMINSGLPIESIILLFMGYMTENEEEKLKLKMKEVVVAEQFERANRKLKSDQDFARDVLDKIDRKVLTGEQYEKGKKDNLEKMAGRSWDPGISKEYAAQQVSEANAMLAKWDDGTITETEKLSHPQSAMEMQKMTEAREGQFVFKDVELNPTNFGFTQKSSTILMQEMQEATQKYKQVMETFSSILRLLQDMVNKVIQNIR